MINDIKLRKEKESYALFLISDTPDFDLVAALMEQVKSAINRCVQHC